MPMYTTEEFYNKYALHYVLYTGPDEIFIKSDTTVLIIGYLRHVDAIIYQNNKGIDLSNLRHITFHPLYIDSNILGNMCYSHNLNATGAYPSPYLNITQINLINYPHKCPKCSSPAYIGFSNIDCSKKCISSK